MTDLVVTPWHNKEQRDKFLDAWKIYEDCPFLVLQHDAEKEGCAITKNKGITEAMRRGADMVVVLDDDCYPTAEAPTITELIARHRAALEPQPVEMFQLVTDPPSRGTPFKERSWMFPVAASMGFWTEIGDYCAVRQLSYDCKPMLPVGHRAIFGRYFPLCGMNLAFRPRVWSPWCDFIDVKRFDDIWMGWLWQRTAYARGHCFNLGGPMVRHSRQSNVWQNLKEESVYLQENETLWREIATNKATDYDSLRALLPCASAHEA